MIQHETTRRTHNLHYSFGLVKRWLTQWGHQFPNGTPLTYRKLVLPLHRDTNHWACVAINFDTITITYLDSMSPTTSRENMAMNTPPKASTSYRMNMSGSTTPPTHGNG